jgi:hypothetical protein
MKSLSTLLIVFALSSQGCSSFLPGLLPDERRRTESPWSSFEEAKAAFDLIAIGETTSADLRTLGFHPETTPNIEILSYVDVYRRFVPNDGIRLEDQDPGVRDCVHQRERCNGWQMEPRTERYKRQGNLLLDWFTFRRQVESTGWRFRSLIVVIDERVVYKLWEGNPSEMRYADSIRPLGPLQDFFFTINLALRALL